MDLTFKRITTNIPEFCASHWLLRIPLAIVFIQQGLSKFPVTQDDAVAYDLPYLVWWFVAYGELGAGVGLLAAAFMSLKAISHLPFITECSDMLSRFSGITMCSITTGVIWISEPESLMEVLLYDNLHVFLWVGGLYFALRGNRA
jgi:putative oxidoreductase